MAELGDRCGVCKKQITENEVSIKFLDGKYQYHKGKCSEILGYRFSRFMETLELPNEEFLAWLADDD